MKNPKAKLPARIREKREALGLSQTDAAKKLKVWTGTWNRWETGATIPGGEHLDAIAKVLNVTAMWLEYGVRH